MFFATAVHPSLRRYAAAPRGGALERFMAEANQASAQKSCAYTQDETSFTLALDVPGIAKEQLNIAIEGAVVRVSSKEGAPRTYRSAFELPLEIDAAQSSAKLENGVLTLKLVKLVPASKATELTIH